jgi:hypothetical protein
MGAQTRQGIQLPVNQTVDQNFTLGMQLAESVTVVAEQPRVNTVNAEIKKSMNALEVIDKPSIQGEGRTAFLSLAETFAGFSENPTSGQNNPTASSGSSVNFGAGTRGTTFQINGVNNDDSSENQHRQGVALSTIQDFQVLTNNFSAEFGRGYGAVVLVTTKSGTNDLAGDVYGFFSDNEWNENNFFNRALPLPNRTRTVLGMTAGFPVVRDKLFGFVSGETNATEGQDLRTRDLPPADVANIPRLTLGNDTPANRAFIDNILGRFAGLTANRPDLGPRQFSREFDVNFPDDDYSARLDFDPVSNHHLNSRYQYSTNLRETTEFIPGENAVQDHKQSNLGINYTHVITQNVVGEARYGLGIRDTNVNILAGNDTPIVRFTGVTNGSTIGNAGGFPIQRDQTDHQFVYNLSALVFTNHSLKIGADIRRQRLDDLADNNSRGSWSFTGTCGGVNYPTQYHQFLAGCVTTFTKGYGNFFIENQLDEENLYAEDNWQVWPNLTLNLGARYEHVPATEEVQGRVVYAFDDDSYVDPRLGFAYTIGGNNPVLNAITGGSGKSVIRGGYGTFRGRIFQSIFSQTGANLRFNPPFGANVTFSNSTNLADPTEGFVFTPGIPPTIRTSITIPNEDLHMPYTNQWNLTFERELPWNSAARISYVSKESEDLIRYSPDNLALDPRIVGPVTVVDHPFNAPSCVTVAGVTTCQPDLRGLQITTFNPDPCAGTGLAGVAPTTACPNSVPLADNEFSLRVPRVNQRRPDPRYTNNLVVSNDAASDYKAVELELTRRYSNNLHFQAAYTYSEYMDNGSEATFVGAGDSNIWGPNREYSWAPSRFDTPHRFTFSGSYRLPFLANRNDILGILLGGWQIAPVFRYSSGTPFSVTSTAADVDLDGFSEARPVILDRSIDGRTIDDPDTSVSQLPRSAFRLLVPGDPIEAIVPRNSFRGDDIWTLDLGLYKNFSMPWNNHTLSLRFEGYNVTDEVQFAFPDASVTATTTTFGRITAQRNGPRILQVGLRYLF